MIGWFRYGRHPEGRVGEWQVTRTPDDPPIVIYRTGDQTWIIDDDQHVTLNGATGTDIQNALTFARAMARRRRRGRVSGAPPAWI